LAQGLSASSSDQFRLTQSEKLMTWLLTEILRIQKGYDNQDCGSASNWDPHALW